MIDVDICNITEGLEKEEKCLFAEPYGVRFRLMSKNFKEEATVKGDARRRDYSQENGFSGAPLFILSKWLRHIRHKYLSDLAAVFKGRGSIFVRLSCRWVLPEL